MSLDLEDDVNETLDEALADVFKIHGDGLSLSALDSVRLLDESWDEWDDDLIEAIGNLEVDHG